MPTRTRAQSVTDILRQRIIEGDLPPDTHLYEIPLAEELNVSRTPIRAALNALAKDGLLDYLPNRGYIVRRFGAKDLTDAYEVRAVLEGLACRIVAAQGLGEEDAARIQSCLDRGDRILAKGRLDPADLVPYREMNMEFHETLLRCSGNHWIADFVHRAHHVPYVSDRAILWVDYSIQLRTHDDHHRIFVAIRQHEPWRAEALMREHIYFAGQVFRRYFVNGDIVPTMAAIAAPGAQYPAGSAHLPQARECGRT